MVVGSHRLKLASICADTLCSVVSTPTATRGVLYLFSLYRFLLCPFPLYLHFFFFFSFILWTFFILCRCVCEPLEASALLFRRVLGPYKADYLTRADPNKASVLLFRQVFSSQLLSAGNVI